MPRRGAGEPLTGGPASPSRPPAIRSGTMSAIRDVLHPGGSAIGLWATIPSPVTAELAARSGAGYVVVDQQHGAVGPGELLAMLQAIQGAGRPALVRVGSHDPWVIGHALDLGAQGVIVPLVDSPEEAEAIVAACRYAPAGRRSWGRVRGEPARSRSC